MWTGQKNILLSCPRCLDSMLAPGFWNKVYTLAIYSKYFIVQRGIKSIFSVPAHCQNLNILNRRKAIQQLKTISDNVLTAYIFTIKGNSIDLLFQYTRHWLPWVPEATRSLNPAGHWPGKRVWTSHSFRRALAGRI